MLPKGIVEAGASKASAVIEMRTMCEDLAYPSAPRASLVGRCGHSLRQLHSLDHSSFRFEAPVPALPRHGHLQPHPPIRHKHRIRQVPVRRASGVAQDGR
jgi:hypothetical protein